MNNTVGQTIVFCRLPEGASAATDHKKRWSVLPLVLALAVCAHAQTVDEHEIVRRIHDRIAAHASSGKMQAYKVIIPNTTISYGMAPIPAGDFTMGSAQKKDEQPTHKVHLDAFWMQVHEITWDEYRLFMFANQAGEIAHKDETVDGVSRPTRPYVEMSFGMGINGFPAISMTQHAA